MSLCVHLLFSLSVTLIGFKVWGRTLCSQAKPVFTVCLLIKLSSYYLQSRARLLVHNIQSGKMSLPPPWLENRKMWTEFYEILRGGRVKHREWVIIFLCLYTWSPSKRKPLLKMSFFNKIQNNSYITVFPGSRRRNQDMMAMLPLDYCIVMFLNI